MDHQWRLMRVTANGPSHWVSIRSAGCSAFVNSPCVWTNIDTDDDIEDCGRTNWFSYKLSVVIHGDTDSAIVWQVHGGQGIAKVTFKLQCIGAVGKGRLIISPRPSPRGRQYGFPEVRDNMYTHGCLSFFL